ncbi:hypothetical protein EJB05_03432, partial [Eragrostis curvula]
PHPNATLQEGLPYPVPGSKDGGAKHLAAVHSRAARTAASAARTLPPPPPASTFLKRGLRGFDRR